MRADSGRRRRKTERPREILAAAFEEFAGNGFAATRLEDVAARAGVTKGTIYVYFASKEDLYVATLKEMTCPAFEHLQTLMAAPQGDAANILAEHLLFVAEHTMADRQKREIIRMLMADGPRFPQLVERWHAEVMVPAFEAFAAVIEYGIARGEFRTSAAVEFPHMIMAPVVLANVWQTMFDDRHPLDLRRYFAASVDVLVHGLKL